MEFNVSHKWIRALGFTITATAKAPTPRHRYRLVVAYRKNSDRLLSAAGAVGGSGGRRTHGAELYAAIRRQPTVEAFLPAHPGPAAKAFQSIASN